MPLEPRNQEEERIITRNVPPRDHQCWQDQARSSLTSSSPTQRKAMATNTCMAQYPGALMPLFAEVGLPLRRNVQGLSLPPPSTLGLDAISSSLGHFSAQLVSPFPARGPSEQHLQRLGEIRTPPGSVSPSSSSLSSRPPSSTGLWQLASRKRPHESSQVEEPR